MRHRGRSIVAGSDTGQFRFGMAAGCDSPRRCAASVGGGVAMGRQGQVYVADWANHRIQEFDANGRLLAAWGRLGQAPGEFFLPAGIAVDGRGDVYVADAGSANIRPHGGRPVSDAPSIAIDRQDRVSIGQSGEAPAPIVLYADDGSIQAMARGDRHDPALAADAAVTSSSPIQPGARHQVPPARAGDAMKGPQAPALAGEQRRDPAHAPGLWPIVWSRGAEI